MTMDSTPYVVEAVRPIIDQLWARLDNELSERDLTAITTALFQAAVAGVVQGVATVEFGLSGLGITLCHDQDQIAVTDLWAERYGDDPE